MIGDLINLLRSLSEKFAINIGITDLTNTLERWKSVSYQVGDFVKVISPSTDTNTILQELLRVSNIFFQIIFAYILSFVWLLEYEKVQAYFEKLQHGPFAFFFKDVRGIIGKVQSSFGLVFRAQSKIAVVNTILTVLGLFIIGIFHGGPNNNYIFPYI